MRNITVLCATLAILSPVFASEKKSESFDGRFFQVKPILSKLIVDKEFPDISQLGVMEILDLVRTPITVNTRHDIQRSRDPRRPHTIVSSVDIKVKASGNIENYDLEYYCQDRRLESNSRCETTGQWTYDLDYMGRSNMLFINYCCSEGKSTQLGGYDRTLSDYYEYYSNSELAQNYFNAIGQHSSEVGYDVHGEDSACTGEVTDSIGAGEYSNGNTDENGDMCVYSCSDESGNFNGGASQAGSQCVIDETSNGISDDCKGVLHGFSECNTQFPNQEQACTNAVNQQSGGPSVSTCIREYESARRDALSSCVDVFDALCGN